jgi:hypothetical protein
VIPVTEPVAGATSGTDALRADGRSGGRTGAGPVTSGAPRLIVTGMTGSAAHCRPPATGAAAGAAGAVAAGAVGAGAVGAVCAAVSCFRRNGQRIGPPLLS